MTFWAIRDMNKVEQTNLNTKICFAMEKTNFQSVKFSKFHVYNALLRNEFKSFIIHDLANKY